MSDVSGILFELCYNHLEACDNADGEKSEAFNLVNNKEYIEHDVYSLFDLILGNGINEFYVFEEPGKKKKKRRTQKMFGRPQFDNVSSKLCFKAIFDVLEQKQQIADCEEILSRDGQET